MALRSPFFNLWIIGTKTGAALIVWIQSWSLSSITQRYHRKASKNKWLRRLNGSSSLPIISNHSKKEIEITFWPLRTFQANQSSTPKPTNPNQPFPTPLHTSSPPRYSSPLPAQQPRAHLPAVRQLPRSSRPGSRNKQPSSLWASPLSSDFCCCFPCFFAEESKNVLFCCVSPTIVIVVILCYYECLKSI